MTALCGWCTFRRQRRPPFPSLQAQLESGVRGKRLPRLERGKGCKALPIATQVRHIDEGPVWGHGHAKGDAPHRYLGDHGIRGGVND